MQIHQKQEGDLSLVPPQAVENFCLITILTAKTKKNLNKPSQTIANSANKNTNHARFYQIPEEEKFSWFHGNQILLFDSLATKRNKNLEKCS